MLWKSTGTTSALELGHKKERINGVPMNGKLSSSSKRGAIISQLVWWALELRRFVIKSRLLM